MNELEYLGDGLYACLQNGNIWLYANSHTHPTDQVCLEPQVLKSFESYIKKLREKNEL